MADTRSIATRSTDTSSLKRPVPELSSPSTKTTHTAKEKSTSSWRDKLPFSSKPEQTGKEKWRDASLSEDERWKEWQKAKDKEQKNGGATGVYSEFFKAKGAGKWGYWLAQG
ncbi:hypothetical protein BDU57DRAFT_531612 [Ampelomyces quisqualis]|uniref:Uncharacterized protein n=1 Tax=Ampelomyces quisqualis TaxID=50730 RepID=A0A6A5QFZ4_AMPQU|nr:hypothetical protein BDU57DRAFT_531612 [Ampelomyces quisqualis]